MQGSSPRVSTQALIGDEQDRSKDWKEAFSHHPKVGADVVALALQAPGQRHRPEVERAGLAGASEETLQELAQRHREYGEKFGFAFLIYATRGKSADKMLAALKARMPNDPALELKVAAAEQAKAARCVCAWCVHGVCMVCALIVALYIVCMCMMSCACMQYPICTQAKITYLRLEKLELAGLERDADGGG